MSDSVSVDPDALRVAAGRLDTLFTSSAATLQDNDQAIAENHDGWRDEAATAFGRFTGYLDGRRSTLRQHLAELSEALTVAANTLRAHDDSHAAVINRQNTPPSTLDL
ncbi:WXG100 family type VII secretion target [Nocardia callitridis]|uniref:WXG100 family type VII secretion target n=1 Tax=Nocardia callitridis TaxID=648753 RepID=A0ABP9K8Z6_9NOCA